MAKRLVVEKAISVREAERQLDADAYFEEHQWWAPGGLHQEFLYQQMFLHAAATIQSEHDQAICWGRREEHICQEVLDSIKECLWCKQLSTLPEAEQKWRLADACRPNPQAECAAVHHTTHEQFATMQQDSCKEALTLARYAHQCALVAVAILEEKMEQMSCSLSHWHLGSNQHSGSCQCSGSHWHWRSQSLGWQREDPQVMSY